MDLKTLNELEERAKSAQSHAFRHTCAGNSLKVAESSNLGLKHLLTARDPNGPFYTYSGVSESQQIAINEIYEIIDEMKNDIIAMAIARVRVKELSLLALAVRRHKLIDLSILQVEGANEQE